MRHAGPALTGIAPESNHLALLTDATGSAIGIPPGAVLFLVEKGAEKRTTPMILVEVARDRLVFACACRKSDCTLRYQYRMKRVGRHPLPEGEGK